MWYSKFNEGYLVTYMNDLEKQSIIIWLISYLVTFGMDTYTTYLFLMYIGNSGYKFNDIDMDKAEKKKIIAQLKEEAVDEITAMFNCRRCERFGH